MVRKKVSSKKKQVRARPDPVFIPVVYDSYRANKMNLLNAQVKVLECVKTINKVKELQKQKEELKLLLYRNLSEAMRLYYKLQDSMPLVANPGFMKKLEKTVEIAVNYSDSNSSFSYSKKVSQPDELDSELREIQEKLNALNSSKDL